jgi:diaminopimelate decarboxylase
VRAHEAGALHAEIGQVAPGWLRVPADPNALVPALWPGSVRRDDHGALVIDGLDVRDLAREYGTPLHVCDERDFRTRCRAFAEALPGGDVYYAAKAFLCLATAKWASEERLGLDVCTGGELAVALHAGVPPARIAFHGNNKSPAEIARAVEAKIGRFVLDSAVEIARVATAADQCGVRADVMVRVNVGVEAHTHEYIATAHEDQKFGFPLPDGQAAEAVATVLSAPSLRLVGLHSHLGSQIFDAAAFEVSARRLVELHCAVRDRHGVELAELGLGGGFGIAYTLQDDPLTPAELGLRLRSIVQHECAAAGIATPRLSIEPGRAIAGPSVITVYEVGTVKPVRLDGGASRTYVSVDGGMSDNIRTALYGAAYSCTLASRRSDAAPMLVRVVGKHCESGDVVVNDEFLPADVEPGDLLAVPGTGAYCRSMSSNYNHVPRPPVIAVRDGTARVIIRRETEQDLLRLDAS